MRTAFCLVGLIAVLSGGCGPDRLVGLDRGAIDVGPPAPARWEHGLNLTAYEARTLAPQTALDAVSTAIRATRTTTISIVPVWYVSARDAADLAADPDKTLRDDDVRRMAARARTAGLRIAIKPHVDSRDGTFRGELVPGDLPAFFDAYGAMIDRYAALAQEVGADTLVIGTELVQLAGDAERWRGLAARARQRFQGRLTYAANWVQDAEDVGFWDALDVVGVDAYMPLETEDTKPTVGQLRDAWRPWVRRLAALRQRTGKDILLTELGYASRVGSTRQPAIEGTGAPDPELQARAYTAALGVLTRVPFIRGIWWWEWEADGRSREAAGPGTYTPREKPAATVLRGWSPER